MGQQPDFATALGARNGRNAQKSKVPLRCAEPMEMLRMRSESSRSSLKVRWISKRCEVQTIGSRSYTGRSRKMSNFATVGLKRSGCDDRPSQLE